MFVVFLALLLLVGGGPALAGTYDAGSRDTDGASCGRKGQPCCATQPACDVEPLGTIPLAVQDGYAELVDAFSTQQVLMCANGKCVPCGELDAPCCPVVNTDGSPDASYDETSYFQFFDPPADNPFGRCKRGTGVDANARVCSAKTNGICKQLDKALSDGNLNFTYYGPPREYCPRIYFDAEYRAFEHYGDCSADVDSRLNMPSRLLNPAKGPMPPATFDGCLDSSTFDNITCRDRGNLDVPISGCIKAGYLVTANVTLPTRKNLEKLLITGYAPVPGMGRYDCLYHGAADYDDSTFKSYGLCNEDGILPFRRRKAGKPPRYNPRYPADRPFCDANAPYGISYKASNGTIVPLLYMIDAAVLQNEEDAPDLCCTNVGGVAYGSSVGGGPGRCKNKCKRVGRRKCQNCRQR